MPASISSGDGGGDAAAPKRASFSRACPTIYLAGPCGGHTGGMYQVSVYLQQASREVHAASARFRLMDTRGAWAVVSPLYVLVAAVRILLARVLGQLAGVHIHVSERLSLVRKGLLVALCRAIRSPVVLHLHAAELEQHYAGLPRALRAGVRAVFRGADCCIALGQASASFMEHELGVSPARIEVVTNGVPEPAVSARAAGAPDTFRVLFVGQLSERKGVSVLLHALADARLRDVPVQLSLAGRGDIARYQALADALGIGAKVRFTGWMEKKAVDQLLAESDVFVLPSFHEGLPLAILEALALGVPTVCTPVGEIPHVLEHGRSVHIVPAGDAEALAGALVALAGNAALRRTLSRGGRAAYEARFSLTAFAAAIATVHRRYFGVSALDGQDGGWTMSRGGIGSSASLLQDPIEQPVQLRAG